MTRCAWCSKEGLKSAPYIFFNNKDGFICDDCLQALRDNGALLSTCQRCRKMFDLWDLRRWVFSGFEAGYVCEECFKILKEKRGDKVI